MALIVEDGSGVINADALVDVAFVDDYADRYGKTGWTALDTATKEIHIRRATMFVASKFPFNTIPLYTDQVFPFPAWHYIYRGSYLEGIPFQLKQAVAELAIISTTTDLVEGVVARDYIYKRTNVGGVEKELRWAAPGKGDARIFGTVEMILAPLLGIDQGGFSQRSMTPA